MQETTLNSFLEQLASDSPTPGGGGAAALMGALAAALIAMVCRLTIGKKDYAAVEQDCRRILEQADRFRARCLEMMSKDEEAFAAFMEAYRMPRADEAEKLARKTAVQRTLRLATETPLQCAELCSELLTLSREISEIGNRNVISDAGVALLAAYGGMRSAALNVYTNLGGLEDAELAESSAKRLEECLLLGEGLEADYQAVRVRLPGA